MSSLFLRNVRLVPIRTAAPVEPVSVRLHDGVVTSVGHQDPEPGDRVIEGDGRWVIPGLWDQHVHFTQWAQTFTRLDVSGTRDPREVLELVRPHVGPVRDSHWLFGFGFRLTDWTREPTVAELDAVTGDQPVVLTSGDAHAGWLNTAALRALGAAPVDGPLTEVAWFELMARVVERNAQQDGTIAVRNAIEGAAARGVVGVADLEFAEPLRAWPERVAAGADALWVRTAVYPDHLDDVLASGLRTGAPLTPDGLITLGPLKIISDGSLNTRTAFCHAPYAGGHSHGVQNHDRAELIELLRLATDHGLRAAVHAIGDAAAHEALAAFAASGATGSIEHAQLMMPEDIAAMASLGLVASVQPGHLLDDRDTAAHLWPDRTDRCFALRSMLDAGVRMQFGSDAPVAALDPWHTMAAAVHRSADAREPWNPAESVTPAEALAASVDGADTVQVGQRADLVVIDRDPLAETDDSAAAAALLRAVGVEATMRGGRLTHTIAGLAD